MLFFVLLAGGVGGRVTRLPSQLRLQDSNAVARRLVRRVAGRQLRAERRAPRSLGLQLRTGVSSTRSIPPQLKLFTFAK